MPFKSKAQQRYMFANHPDLAREMADKMKKEKKSYKSLPEKVKKAAEEVAPSGNVSTSEATPQDVRKVNLTILPPDLEEDTPRNLEWYRRFRAANDLWRQKGTSSLYDTYGRVTAHGSKKLYPWKTPEEYTPEYIEPEYHDPYKGYYPTGNRELDTWSMYHNRRIQEAMNKGEPYDPGEILRGSAATFRQKLQEAGSLENLLKQNPELAVQYVEPGTAYSQTMWKESSALPQWLEIGLAKLAASGDAEVDPVRQYEDEILAEQKRRRVSGVTGALLPGIGPGVYNAIAAPEGEKLKRSLGTMGASLAGGTVAGPLLGSGIGSYWASDAFGRSRLEDFRRAAEEYKRKEQEEMIRRVVQEGSQQAQAPAPEEKIGMIHGKPL